MHPDDRRLARRLDREARSAAKVHARAQRAHARALARQERLVRCARERLPKQVLIVAGAVVGAIVWQAGWLFVLAAVVGLRAVGSVLRLTRPVHVPPPPGLPVPAVPPPPPVGSVAFSA